MGRHSAGLFLQTAIDPSRKSGGFPQVWKKDFAHSNKLRRSNGKEGCLDPEVASSGCIPAPLPCESSLNNRLPYLPPGGNKDRPPLPQAYPPWLPGASQLRCLSAPGLQSPPVRSGAPRTLASPSSPEKPNWAPWDKTQGEHCGLQGFGRGGASPWPQGPEAWVLPGGPREPPASLPHRLPRVTWPQFWWPVVRRNAMNVFCSSHTMKSFPPHWFRLTL